MLLVRSSIQIFSEFCFRFYFNIFVYVRVSLCVLLALRQKPGQLLCRVSKPLVTSYWHHHHLPTEWRICSNICGHLTFSVKTQTTDSTAAIIQSVFLVRNLQNFPISISICCYQYVFLDYIYQ